VSLLQAQGSSPSEEVVPLGASAVAVAVELGVTVLVLVLVLVLGVLSFLLRNT